MGTSFVMRKAQDGRSVPSIVEEVLLRNVEHMINQQFKLFFSGFIFLSNLNPVDAERTKTALRRIFQDFVQLIEMEDSVAEEPNPNGARNKSIYGETWLHRQFDYVKQRVIFFLILWR